MTEAVLKAVLVVVSAHHVVSGGLALLAPDVCFEQIGCERPERPGPSSEGPA